MKRLTPAGKIGIVVAGFLAALLAGWLATALRERLLQGPDAQAAAGMYAEGDALLGVAVFALVALLPLALGLYWLRPVPRFWSVLAGSALVFAVTGLIALAVNLRAEPIVKGWLLLTHLRIAVMPLSALTFLTCAIFAPQSGFRFRLLIAGGAELLAFAAVVVVKFLLPH